MGRLTADRSRPTIGPRIVLPPPNSSAPLALWRSASRSGRSWSSRHDDRSDREAPRRRYRSREPPPHAEGVHAVGVLGARRGGPRPRSVLPEGGVVLLDPPRVGPVREVRDRGRRSARVLAVRAGNALPAFAPVPDGPRVGGRRVPLVLLRGGRAAQSRSGPRARAGDR